MPNESITLGTIDKSSPSGIYAVQLHDGCRQASAAPRWLSPAVVQVELGKLTIKNTSLLPQDLLSKDVVAQAVRMVDPAEVEPLRQKDQIQTPKLNEPTWENISIDPHGLLPPDARASFRKVNMKFKDVFEPDLPKYNGFYGKVEAVINVPRALPPSLRLKDVPWYPRRNLSNYNRSLTS